MCQAIKSDTKPQVRGTRFGRETPTGRSKARREEEWYRSPYWHPMGVHQRGAPDQATVMTRCWEWTKYRDKAGYGRMTYNGKHGYLVHRAVYEEWYGEVPAELDHICKNRACYNPNHLQPTTHLDNIRRGWPERTHCIRGHAFSGPNLYVDPKGHRFCRACRALRSY